MIDITRMQNKNETKLNNKKIFDHFIKTEVSVFSNKLFICCCFLGGGELFQPIFGILGFSDNASSHSSLERLLGKFGSKN